MYDCQCNSVAVDVSPAAGDNDAEKKGELNDQAKESLDQECHTIDPLIRAQVVKVQLSSVALNSQLYQNEQDQQSTLENTNQAKPKVQIQKTKDVLFQAALRYWHFDVAEIQVQYEKREEEEEGNHMNNCTLSLGFFQTPKSLKVLILYLQKDIFIDIDFISFRRLRRWYKKVRLLQNLVSDVRLMWIIGEFIDQLFIDFNGIEVQGLTTERTFFTFAYNHNAIGTQLMLSRTNKQGNP